jgi:hypothetical protein
MKRALEYKIEQHFRGIDEVFHVQSIVIHPGPKAWKTATLLTVGNSESGTVAMQRLILQTWLPLPFEEGVGYDFKHADQRWHCEGEDEIETVRLFLNGAFPEAGKYHIVKQGSELGDLISTLGAGGLGGAELTRLVEVIASDQDLIGALADSTSGGLLAEAVELQRRRKQLDKLRAIVSDPSSRERDHIHPHLKQMGWVFGGRYVGESRRKQLSTGDVLDIPLLRPTDHYMYSS